ncbi:hypothetical protein MTO96_034348 [Rhipicephalus appendiculatus]
MSILDNFSVIGRTTKERIIDQVRAILQGISPLSHRLHYVGGIYCWLAAPEDVLSPWELYRANPFNVNMTDFGLHRRIARELGIQGLPSSVCADIRPKSPLRVHYCTGHGPHD